MALSSSEDAWNSYKELKSTVWKYLNQPPQSDLPSIDLENVLRRHKQHFFALLQNPPRNPKKREELKNGMVEGINVKGIGHQVLSRELYQETIILSDMFEINELVALDLLCTAQLQLQYYPDLPRGLVAVLLYYDGQKALLTTLLYLVQARSGIQWSVKIKPELSRFITDYTDQLMEGGIFSRIFDLLRSLDLTKEIEKLQENLALGGPRHRRQVTDLFNDIRSILADVVFSWATQCGLPKDPTLGLINYLRQTKLESEASGAIDNVTLNLLMALLCAFDLSVFHTREDGEEVVQSLPILSDTGFISAVVNEFLQTRAKWVCEGLQAVSTFGLSVCLASLRLVPQNYIFQDSINKEDMLVDASIEMNAFAFINNVLLENQILYKELYLYKRMHNLLTDFIVYMYPKVKHLRMKANEVSRTLQVYIREGLEAPPELPRYFESLLLAIGKFYSNNILDPDYTLHWWSPVELNPKHTLNIRTPPRSVALFKFLKLAGDMLPPTLFVPFIKMLSGLSTSNRTARYCFHMLEQTGVHLCRTVSWDHFFTSFGQYFNNLRQEAPPQADTVYRIRPGYHKGVSPQELEGLHAVLLLIRTVAENDDFVRLALCQHPGWSPLTILLGLVSCSVPIFLKADLLLTLASLAKSSENVSLMWENLEASQILVTIPTTSSYAPRGIQTELDEIESRMEEYPLTRAVLKLLDALTDFRLPRALGAGSRTPGFEPYLSFIVNSVFLKYSSRSYRDVSEKWDVALLCLKLFEKFLKIYQPKVKDFANDATATEFNSPPGHHLMLQLNNRTETLNIILDIIDEGNRFFDTYVPFQGQEKVEACTLACLNIVHRTLVLLSRFFSTLAKTSASVVLTNIGKLLLTINRRSGKPDHCINIAKYLSYQQYMPKHGLVAVKILQHIAGTATGHSQFLAVLISTEDSQRAVKGGFCQCMDASNDDTETDNATKVEILRLLKQCLMYTAPNLTHFLMGFDLNHISRTEFQYPGVMGFPRTCLHALLSLLDAVVSKNINAAPPELVESAYHLLYLLASNSNTRGPILRFVRLNKLFFPVHLRHCQTNMSKGPKYLNQMSWLLKTLAIELKMASSTNQVTYLRQLLTFLANVPSGGESQENPFLHQILKIELKDLQGIPVINLNPNVAPDSPKAKRQHTLELEQHREACASLVEFVDSWRQVAEVLVSFMPLEILDAKEQQVFSIKMLLCMMQKVLNTQLLPEVERLLSGSVLLMMDNIKRHYIMEHSFFNVLEHCIGYLKEIIESLVQWIIISDVIDGELRINLYAALVTFLQITNVDTEHQETIDMNRSGYVSRLDGSRYSVAAKDKQLKLCNDVISAFGEKLMEVLCHDFIGGQEICKILAMSSYSHLITLTGSFDWITYLSSRGFLGHIIQSILDSDKELRAMLEPGSGTIKALFLYLAKMLLLVRLAGSRLGAEIILEKKVLGVLSNMTVYSYHPEISKGWQGEDPLEDFLPPPDQQYLQIFMPTLDICNTILTTLGTENHSAVVQITYFLFSHLDVVELILRSGHADLSPMSLKELALLTSVISRTANNNLINIMENPNIVQSNRAQLYRVQRLMLSLIQKFILSEETVKNLLSNASVGKNSFQTSERLLYAMQVASNLLWYARNIVGNNDIEHGEVGVIFYPTLSDPKLHAFHNRTIGSTIEQEISLGVVVQQLLSTVTYQHQVKVTYALLETKIKEIPDMNSVDLKAYIETNMEMCDLDVKRKLVHELLSERLSKKKKEMDYCVFIIETCLYLIWAHLDYFMLKATPNPRNTTYIHPNSSASGMDATLSTTSDAIARVSTEIINNLKQGLVSLFNDSFSKQLLETSQDPVQADGGFIEALLRKIKRLVQFVRPN